MNREVKEGLLLGVAFAGLVSFFPAQAEAQMTGKELCEGAVRYSIKYMPEEEAFELHQARWAILDGDNTTDNEKLIGLVMFEIGQRIAYSMNEEQNRNNTEWWDGVVNTMHASCEAAHETATAENLNDMEGEGNIW
jgi:hypothetical protein